jgi:putative transposase
MKKTYTPAVGAQVVQELLKETKTITQLAAEHSVHPNVLREWKVTVLKGMASLFEKSDSIETLRSTYEHQLEERYAQIGRLTTQVTWLKKKLVSTLTRAERMLLLDRPATERALRPQADLLTLSRRSLYYQPTPPPAEEVAIKHAIDAIYTAQPSYGSRRIAVILERDHHLVVNRKAVQRHMREMGIVGISPGPTLSRRTSEQRVYPYLLRNMVAVRPNHVWAIDITYIRLVAGWMYLVAVLDLYARYVVSWALDDTLEQPFVLDAVSRALAAATPQIWNSDQGSHFTSPQYTSLLEAAGVQISMAGKGRALDNIFIERLWRSVKYEEVYLTEYQAPRDARIGLGRYLRHYNEDRPHSTLGYQTPAAVYYGKERVIAAA